MNDTSNIGVNNTGTSNTTPVTPVAPATPGATPVSTATPSSPVLNNPMGNVNNSQGAPANLSAVQQTAATPQPVTPQPVAAQPVAQATTPVAPQQAAPAQTPVTPVVQNPTAVQPAAVNPTPAAPQQAAAVQTPVTPAPAQNMPVIPNVDELIASAPVVNNTPSTPEPAAQTVDVALPSTPGSEGDQKIEVSMTDNVKIEEKPKKAKKEKEKKEKVVTSDDDEDDENVGANKAPVIIAIVFAVLLVIIFVYYFVIMTPRRVFTKAIDSTFDSITGLMTGFSNNENKSKMYLDLGFKLDTDNEAFAKEIEAGQQEKIDDIKNDYLRGIISFDIPKENIKIELQSHKLLESLKLINIDKNGTTARDSKTGEYNSDKLKQDAEKHINPIIVSEVEKTDKGYSVSEKDYNDGKEYTQMLDLNFYAIDNKTYVGPISYLNYNDIVGFGQDRFEVKQPIKLDIFNELLDKLDLDSKEEDMPTSLKTFIDEFKNSEMDFNYDRINALAKLINLTKARIIENTPDGRLDRGIELKKVGDSTALALKAHVHIEENSNDGMLSMRDIYNLFFDDYINNDKSKNVLDGEQVDVLKELSTLFGVSEEASKSLLQYIRNRDSLFSKKWDITLHMNLANTELISFEMYINDTYHADISYLNGYYQIRLDITENRGTKNEKVKFKIDATYDRNIGVVDGLGYLDNDNTYLAVKFDYERVTDSSTGVKNGNKLDLGFYNHSYDESKSATDPNNLKNRFALLKCNLSYYDSERGEEDDIERTNYNLVEEIKDAVSIDDIDYATHGFRPGDITGKFLNNFTSHIDFLVDHLLYNKGDAAKNRHKDPDEKSDDKKEETKKEETTKEETKTVEEETKTEEKKEEENTTPVSKEDNKATEEKKEEETKTEDNSENTSDNSSENNDTETTNNE